MIHLFKIILAFLWYLITWNSLIWSISYFVASYHLLLQQNFGPKIHQFGGLEGRAKPGLVVDAQLGDLNQTTTKNALEKAQNTQQLTKDWLK